MLIDFDPPAGVSREGIARTFTAFRIGVLAFENEGFHRGPFQKERGSDASWQLDETNDFFLFFLSDGKARVGCRYDSQIPELQALVRLFQIRFPAEPLRKRHSAQ